ncbi:hypothetical protein ASPCADRAFT_508541 [Aspergillus carbonarius ITEM 5010]|uniref:Thioesterase domain-containing protein n=1 Tax=Aspergillus carbonarius (strain ITEM 5010) TaxID=602072 RepID=A0A1R3RFY9_ASPC5|nr:hypothetical protein ASPCADRAFT_508541 [Aspergillus carbonarius ITEM 5010]
MESTITPLLLALTLTLTLLLLATYKNLPWVWHLRIFHTLLPSQTHPFNPTHLFHPTITTTRSPLSECDYNIHKSNSTYFTDIDISHATLRARLFGSRVSLRPVSASSIIMILGGVQCVFRREIKPYQGYELWSRVLSWDGKWIYLVSHFVERGGDDDGGVKEEEDLKEEKKKKKMVFATSVSRYVFKQGRRTYPPERMIRECGLLEKRAVTPGTEELEVDVGDLGKKIEERRCRDLEKAQLRMGWDAVHEAFEGV